MARRPRSDATKFQSHYTGKCSRLLDNPQLILQCAQAGVPSNGTLAAAAQQWGECSMLPHASGLELCSAGPQEAGLGLGAGASLDRATASALLAALANGSLAGAAACAALDSSLSQELCAVANGSIP